jgi:hypothetical protein
MGRKWLAAGFCTFCRWILHFLPLDFALSQKREPAYRRALFFTELA